MKVAKPVRDTFVESFTEAFHREFMQDRGLRINYLRHGAALRRAT